MSETKMTRDEEPNQVADTVLVSVSMVTYNHSKFIRQALDSVLMQRVNFDYEICIGEDGSDDGTREICIEYAKKYPNKIRLFLRSREDVIIIRGRSTGRSNGIRTRQACRGKYVALLEGDDFWIDSNKLQRQYDYMELHPDASLCAGAYLEWHCDVPSRSIIKTYDSVSREVSISELSDTACPVHANTFFYRRDSLGAREAEYNKHLFGDILLLYLLTAEAGKFYYDNSLSLVYRASGAGVWSSVAMLSRLEELDDFWRDMLTWPGFCGFRNGLKIRFNGLMPYYRKPYLRPFVCSRLAEIWQAAPFSMKIRFGVAFIRANLRLFLSSVKGAIFRSKK